MALWVSDRTRLPDRLVDPQGLVTVVGNLVDNALDAAAGTPHARVEVELRTEGRTAVLVVRDTGSGVPPDRRELIFNEGWSTKEAPAHRERGIGLSEAVNDLVRAGLTNPPPPGAFRQTAHDLGEGIDVSNVADAIETLDGPATR